LSGRTEEQGIRPSADAHAPALQEHSLSADTFSVHMKVKPRVHSRSLLAVGLLLVVLLVLVGGCATTEPQETIPRDEHERELRALEQELAAAREQAAEETNALSTRIEELRAENTELRGRLAEAEAELAELRSLVAELKDRTNSASPEAALDRLDVLLAELESLRELARDRAFAESLMRSFEQPEEEAEGQTEEQAPAPSRQGVPDQRPEEEAADPTPTPTPNADHTPDTEPSGEARRAEDPDDTVGPGPRIAGGFIRVDRVSSSYIGEREPLAGDPDVAVTPRLPSLDGDRLYTPLKVDDLDTGLIPLVRYSPTRPPSLIFLIRVRYSTEDAPLYLEGVELQTSETAQMMQVRVDPVRRLSDGVQRLEEGLVHDHRSVTRMVALMDTSGLRVQYTGAGRSLTETAPQSLRGRVSTMLYVLRALGGDLPGQPNDAAGADES
jgi:hypothetical protein